MRAAGRWAFRGLGIAAAVYGGCVAAAFLRYGHAESPTADEVDDLLDRFMPLYDVVERHHIRVAAPAALTFAAATEIDLFRSFPVRAIFRTREWVMGSAGRTVPAALQFLEMTRSIGWGVLAERRGHEIVMGAITQPWQANVVFQSLPPEQFAAFNEPGYVKIAWTLRADADGDTRSVFRTETRVIATDAGARTRFRRYWALASPGIVLIRQLMLRPLKDDAERRERGLRSSSAMSHVAGSPAKGERHENDSNHQCRSRSAPGAVVRLDSTSCD